MRRKRFSIGGSGGGGSVIVPSDADPEASGVADPGVSTEYSRADHVHPTTGLMIEGDLVYPTPPVIGPSNGAQVQAWGVPHEACDIVGGGYSIGNVDLMFPFSVKTPVTLTACAAEVTTGPASDATLRLGLYGSDSNGNPIGAPLLDIPQAVLSGATGVYSNVIDVDLDPGIYWEVANPSVALGLRGYRRVNWFIRPTMGASPYFAWYTTNRTSAAFLTDPPYGTTQVAWGSQNNGFFLLFDWEDR